MAKKKATTEKKKPTTRKVLNEEKLNEVLMEENHFNWLIIIGVEKIKEGKSIGSRMELFLTNLEILS